MRFALLTDGVVTNVINWDGEEEYTPPGGCTIIEVSDDVSIGWSLVEDEWIAPETHDTPAPSEDEAVAEAKNTAVAALVSLGVSEAVARTIVGLPPDE